MESLIKEIAFKEGKEENIVERQYSLFEEIYSEVMVRATTYLRKCGVRFHHLPGYLKDPKNSIETRKGLKRILEKFILESISKHFFKLQEHDLTIKFVYHSILKKIFKRGYQ